MLYGVDISSYQSGPPTGKDFYWIKATEGESYFDSDMPGWVTEVERWGKLAGVYHFAHPTNDPISEADFFLSRVRPYLKPGILVSLDHETATGSASHDASWAQQWCAHVEAALHMKPVVYCNQDFADNGRCAGLGGYPLWLARYAAIKSAGAGPWKTATFQQYSDVPEDEDVFFGDRNAWMSLAGASSPAPSTEDEMALLESQDTITSNDPVAVLCPQGAAWATYKRRQLNLCTAGGTGTSATITVEAQNGNAGAPWVEIAKDVQITNSSGRWSHEVTGYGVVRMTRTSGDLSVRCAIEVGSW